MSEQLWMEDVKVEASGEAARRIVAALRALHGIPTEALEDGVLGELLGSVVATHEDSDNEINFEREDFLLERLGFLGGAAAECCGRHRKPREVTPADRKCLDCLTKLTRERRANDARERGELV